ncbi:MAG: rRNA maturation RNase YbeY [Lachnospiraceae bacterium]|nr:rRNA maturation RNase YbeY [Lachnospiraceae bacterium]
MTIIIEEEIHVDFDFEYRNLAEEVINFALDFEKFPYEAEVNLTLVDNPSIQEINREYREIDAPTDVLSFPMLDFEQAGDFSGIEEDVGGSFNPDTGEVLLGDIVISVPKVFEQAENYGHSPKREYAFLIVHSVLHLLGYDHMTPEEATFMENKQKDILNAMNILR